MGEPTENTRELLKGVVRRTSAHEGTYTSLNLNTDDAGLSFGMLQWAQRTGALGELLAELHHVNPARFDATFGPAADELLKATRAGSLAPVDGRLLWQEPWISRFRAAGSILEFQAVQDRLAISGIYMTAALEAARILGTCTERGLSVTYDTSVQQGPGTATRVARLVMAGSGASPVEGLEILRAYVARAAARFRTTTPPTKPLNRHLTWKKVGGEWHAFAGKFDLYLNITRRRGALISDTTLSDDPVCLDGIVAGSHR